MKYHHKKIEYSRILDMKTKIPLIVIVISIFLIIATFSWIYVSNKNWDISIYFKNLSDNWILLNKLEYKKWNKVEITWIINNVDALVNIDISKIKEKIEIKSIKINWKDSNENELNKVISNSDNPTRIDIIWIAKDVNIWEDTVGLIKYNKQEDIISEDKEELVKINKNEPSRLRLSNNLFSSNMNNILEIRWINIDAIDYVIIWEKSFKPIYFENVAYITINKKTFRSWEYFIAIQTSKWAIKTLENRIKFSDNSTPIDIWNITPKNISSSKDEYVVLQWNWFKKLISIQLSNNVVFKDTQFQIINDNIIAVKIPKWISRWSYHFNLMNTAWIFEIKDNKINITKN